jgi:hypothetical protein
MTTIRREDLLDCLRKLEKERQECREEGRKHDLGSIVAHGYLGMADGIDFAVCEIVARFGIGAEEIEEEPAAEAKPEKKMAPSKGEGTRERKREIS